MVKFYRSLKDKDFDYDFEYLKKHELSNYNVENMQDFAELVFDTMLTALRSSQVLENAMDQHMDEIIEKVNLLRDYPSDRETLSADLNFDELQYALMKVRESGFFQELRLKDNPSNLMVLFMAMYEVIMKHADSRANLYQVIDLRVHNKLKEDTDVDESEDLETENIESEEHEDDFTPDEQDEEPINVIDIISKSLNKVASNMLNKEKEITDKLKKESEQPTENTDETAEDEQEDAPVIDTDSVEQMIEALIYQEFGLQARVHIYSDKELALMDKTTEIKDNTVDFLKKSYSNLSKTLKQLKDFKNKDDK